MKGEAQFSLGFMKPSETIPFGNPASFGSPGAGGAMGFADPTAGIGYGYVTSPNGHEPHGRSARRGAQGRAVCGDHTTGVFMRIALLVIGVLLAGLPRTVVASSVWFWKRATAAEDRATPRGDCRTRTALRQRGPRGTPAAGGALLSARAERRSADDSVRDRDPGGGVLHQRRVAAVEGDAAFQRHPAGPGMGCDASRWRRCCRPMFVTRMSTAGDRCRPPSTACGRSSIRPARRSSTRARCSDFSARRCGSRPPCCHRRHLAGPGRDDVIGSRHADRPRDAACRCSSSLTATATS